MTDITPPETDTAPATAKLTKPPAANADALYMIAALSEQLQEQLGGYMATPDSAEGYRRLTQTLRTLGEISTFYATKIDELLKEDAVTHS